MKELFMELWTKYRKCSLFAFGMVCFLATGLLVWALPEKPEPPAARAEQTEETAAFLVSQDAPSSSSENAREKNAREKKEGEERSGEKSLDDRWFLYVTGNVRKPGVYRLSPGARLVHLVEAAGGLNNFADPTAVNLAASLEDGMHVHVPKKGERAPEQAVILEIPLSPPSAAPDPRPKIRSSKIHESKPRSAESSGNRNLSNGLIDVNRAAEEELTGLKGIGPVLAKSIVEYRRKNGPFKSVEELVRVKGIGLKKLEGFRDRVVARP